MMTIRPDGSQMALVAPKLTFTTLQNLSLQLGVDILRHLAHVPSSSPLIQRAPVTAAEDSYLPAGLLALTCAKRPSLPASPAHGLSR